MMYEGLTGKKMWSECTSLAEIILVICSKSVVPVEVVAPWVDPRLAKIVNKGLEREVADRWQTMAEVVEALEKFCDASDRVRVTDLARIDDERLAMADVSSPARNDSTRTRLSHVRDTPSTEPLEARPSRKARRGRAIVLGASLCIAAAAGILASRLLAGEIPRTARYEESPSAATPDLPKSSESTEHIAELQISPTDAKVYVNGHPETAEEGHVTLKGEVGESFDIRLELGAASETTRVVMTNTGALQPGRIELTRPKPVVSAPSASASSTAKAPPYWARKVPANTAPATATVRPDPTKTSVPSIPTWQ
jgi:hypothetical protein